MISANQLETSSDGVSRTSYTTGSISPGASKLILLSVFATAGAPVPTPSVSGCGLTWVEVVSQASSNARNLVSLFRALGSSPSSGALTINYGASMNRCIWSITEFGGVKTSGANGADAIIQSDSTTDEAVSSKTITLSAFQSTLNRPYGSIMVDGANITPGSGFTELGEATSSTQRLQAQWHATSADNTVDWSWAGSLRQVSVAVELAALPTGGAFIFGVI